MHLFLAEANGFLHGNRELLAQSIERFVWRKIQTIEAGAWSADAGVEGGPIHTMCVTLAVALARQPSQW